MLEAVSYLIIRKEIDNEPLARNQEQRSEPYLSYGERAADAVTKLEAVSYLFSALL